MKKFLMVLGAMSLSSQMALAANCEVSLTGNDAMQYDKKEVTVDAACKEITLKIAHIGKLPKTAMGHNIVVTKEADKQPVAVAGISAGAANNYLPKGDARVLGSTGLVGGGEKAEAKFPGTKLKKGDKYVYFCSFPGHNGIMTGNLIVK